MSDKRDRTEEHDPIDEEELEEAHGELLPDREVMTTIDPSGTPTDGLGPPPGLLSDT